MSSSAPKPEFPESGPEFPEPAIELPDLVEEIFSAASDLPDSERAALLDGRCAGNARLRRAVERLLESGRRAESAGLWDEPALIHAAREEARDPRLPFAQLGPYHLLSRIGMGGMGTVYLAERNDDGICRQAAIKLAHRAASNPEALRLFEQERRILAKLEHPNIALMLDAGRTPDGLPYLAMQYVEGLPLNRYASENQLSVARRLQLFRTVAAAVAYAHGRGVIHRDLKPNNILVTAEGVPKVLDFGIARLLGETAPGETQPSGPSAGFMTPGYASPEQMAGLPLTPASDVYSLGVLLFELLAGRRPSPAETGPRLAGRELDRIVAKALRRLPEERYPTAAKFVEAIDGYLVSFGKRAWRRWLPASGAAAALGLIAITTRLLPPADPPRAMVRVVAHRAEYETRHASDGRNLYFVERNGFTWNLAHAPANGGPSAPIPTPFKTPTVFDIDVNRAELLLGNDANLNEQQLWVLPTSGGTPRRIGGLTARDAAWSPDKRSLVYTVGSKLYTAKADGSGSRQIARLDCDYLDWPRWSPDGRTIRVTANFPRQITTAIWEMGRDGSNPHRWLPEWKADRTCCGSWIDGGRWYVFQARVNAIIEIWALNEKSGWLRKASRAPVQLTTGPDFMGVPTGELNGSRTYALDTSAQGELDRYDAAKDVAAPYLKGVPARYCSFSRDGQWVAYVTFPGRQLWRSRLDGSQALQLTTPPFRPLDAQWSADGKRIFCMVDQPGARSRLYSIPAGGGSPERIVKGPGTESFSTVSPDGQMLAFGRGDEAGNPASFSLWMYHLVNHGLIELAGSEGLSNPLWSHDGKYLAAIRPEADNAADLELWDFHSKTWKRLVSNQWIASPMWSRDSRFVYYGCADRNDLDAICRVAIPAGRVQIAVASSRFHRADTSHSSFAGLAPDGSPLFMQIYKDFDIASIDLEWR